MSDIQDVIIRQPLTNGVICDICGTTNTEFLQVVKEVPLTPIKKRITFKPVGYVKRVVWRYINILLQDPITCDTNICQTCVSKTFRGFRKGL